jgi:hypothetical protein
MPAGASLDEILRRNGLSPLQVGIARGNGQLAPQPRPTAPAPAPRAKAAPVTVKPRTSNPAPQPGLSERCKAALRFAAQGLLVMPLAGIVDGHCSCGKRDCASAGKHPLTPNGLKDASCNAGKIREWWMKWPAANIGLATGPASGLLVLDVDGEQGKQSLADLESRYGPLPGTTRVTTGKGFHLYFKYPPGRTLRNSQSKIAPGIDLRADGGYAVGPESVHISGTVYTASNPALQRATLPDAWVNLLESPPAPQASTTAIATGTVAGDQPIPRGSGEPGKFKLACRMIKAGDPRDVIMAAVVAMDRKAEHQLGDAECARKVDEWIARYGRGESLAEESLERKPLITTLADVMVALVVYLWEPFIAFGMLTLLSGDPGVGKSFVALAIAASLTLGKLLDGRIVQPANVLYFASAENSLAHSIRPRFDALGGDASRFFVLEGAVASEGDEKGIRAITLADVPTIEKALIETKAKLVIIDPVQSFLGADTDMHRANEVRPLLVNLARLAERYECAVLMLRHLSKGAGGKGIYRGLGSIDFVAAARSELLAGQLPDDPQVRAICHQKNSVGRQGRSIGYAIDSQGTFSWTGESQVMAYDLLAAPEGPERGKRERAQEWLSALLKSGSRGEQEIRSLSEAEGFSYATLRRAKNALRVKSRKGTFGGAWIWSLPEDGPKDASDPDEGSLTI